MTAASAPSVPSALLPLPSCATTAWPFVLPSGVAGRGTAELAAKFTGVVDLFLAKAGEPMRDLTIEGKARRIAEAARSAIGMVAATSPIGRALDEKLVELDAVRADYEARADAAFDRIPAPRLARAQQLSGDLCARVLDPAEVENFAALVRAGDRESTLAAVLLPRTKGMAALRDIGERSFRVLFVDGGKQLLDGVGTVETIAELLRTLADSVRRGLQAHLLHAERGAADLPKVDPRTMLDLANTIEPLQARARVHGLLRVQA